MTEPANQGLEAPRGSIGSLWESDFSGPCAHRTLSGAVTVELAVIGAGFTGLACAIAAARAGVRTVVAEAHKIAFGGSGRNAGQWLIGWPGRTPASVVRQFGPEIGARLNVLNVNAVRRLQQCAAATSRQSRLLRTGVITLARTEKQLETLRETQRQWREYGAEFQILDREELSSHLDTKRYCGALLCAEGGTIQPYAYAVALARDAESAGAEIFEESGVTSIESKSGRWLLHTAQGEISAEKIAITTNAYGGSIWNGLERSFYRVQMAMIASRKLSASILSRMPRRTPFADVGALAIFGGMIDRENRFIASVFPGFADRNNPRALAGAFDRQFRKTFPGAQTPDWNQSWTGDLCITPDRMPKLLGLAPGVAAAIGYSGAGIAMSGVMGEALFQSLYDPRKNLFPASELKLAPMASIAPKILENFAAPISRAIQQM